MPVQIGICDDNTEDVIALKEALYEYDPSFNIKIYADGEDLLEDCSNSKVLFDIIFLDIYMPGLNGIDVAKELRKCLKDIKIVFVSSSNEHYPEAYDVFAFNYLVKPLNKEKLNRILDQALVDIIMERHQQICFSYKGITYRIFCKDIMYIESKDKLVCFHLTDKRILQCYAKLDDILKQLPEDLFIRCHQSFAVNVLHVTETRESNFRIDLVSINISRKYQKEAKEKYFAYLFSRMKGGKTL